MQSSGNTTLPVIEEAKGKNPLIGIDLFEAKDLSHCTLVVDDLVACKKADLDIICTLVNKTARHQKVTPLVLCSHT